MAPISIKLQARSGKLLADLQVDSEVRTPLSVMQLI